MGASTSDDCSRGTVVTSVGKWRATDLTCGVENFYGGFVVVQGDLMHGDSLEISSVVAGGFEACGFELVGDVFCGALVGFGAGVAAFHGVVGEGCGLGPPCGGGGVWLLLRLRGGGERRDNRSAA